MAEVETLQKVNSAEMPAKGSHSTFSVSLTWTAGYAYRKIHESTD